MGSELLPLVYILVTGICVYWAISILFAKDEHMSALSWASGAQPEKSKSPAIEFSRTLVHQFTIQHAVKIKNKKFRERVAALLKTGGLEAELNVDEFIGMKLLWGILLPILLIILKFALQLDYPWIIFLLVPPVGWNFPDFHAKAMRGKRQSSVRADLPFFIDLLALATEAGMDFQGAIQRIVEKSRGKSVLAEELDIVLRDITLGAARADALKNMALRLEMGEVNTFVNAIIDSDSTGSSVTKELKNQSNQMRLERFMRAEKEGAKASQKILIPLMLFILPAVFIMVFAPVALSFMYGSN